MGSMKYGHARVSTDDQKPALQLAALKEAGGGNCFKDEDYREPRRAPPCSAAVLPQQGKGARRR
jgi:hypothetical protein